MPAFRPPSLPWPTRAAGRTLSAALLLAMLVQPSLAHVLAAPLDPLDPTLSLSALPPAAPVGGPCTTVVTTTVDSGYGSLRDAVACAASGGTVTFSGLAVSSTITLTTGEIAFTKTLTIDGSGAPGLAVDGNTTSRIFNIGSGSPVTLTALVLQHGRAIGLGGAVRSASTSSPIVLNQVAVLSSTSTSLGAGMYVAGTLTATQSRFQANVSASAAGGLYVFGALTLTSTDFISNTSSVDGGGVFANGTVTLAGGRFERNTSTNSAGGGLYTANALTLTNTDFYSNTSLRQGGGAYASQAVALVGGRFQGNTSTADEGGGLYTASTLTLTGTEFISNTSQDDGGGVSAAGGGVLTNGRFEGNTCTFATGCLGGGLYSGDEVTLTGTEFISNTSVGDGGGAFVPNTVTLTGGRFQRNACTGSGCQGGGLFAASLYISGTEFISNTAVSRAGGAMAVGAWVTNGRFQGNSCTFLTCDGGGLWGAYIVTDTDFISNTAGGQGGGAAGSEMVMTGGQFAGNACTFSGCIGGGLIATSALLTGVEFISNTSGDHGGGLFAYEWVTATDSLFERNTCLAGNCRGGGVYALTTLALTSTGFLTNTSLSDGGGAYAGSAARLSGGRFQGNACTNNFCDGGGLYSGLTLTLSGTDFISNTSRGGGGGAWTLDAALVSGRFERNACLATCNDGGGGLYAPSLTVTGTEFISNTSSGFGGGARAFVAAVSDGRFQGNACAGASCQGGGLYTASTLLLTDTEFISNTSLSRGGGAVAGTTALATGGRFQGNACTQAGCWGGGLYVASTLSLTDTEFISNTSTANGGGLWVGSPARLTGGRFERNACTEVACQGGGLWADTATLTDTEFISNTSLGFGGGAYGWNTTRVTGGRFEGNTSGSGGGLHAEGTLTLTGTQFLGNTATSAGGGGVFAYEAAAVTQATFQGNTCTDPDCRGGGLWANDSASVAGSTFSGNQAAGRGGGVAGTAALTLTNVTLSGNAAAVSGGGLYAAGTSSARLLNVSVVSNTAPSGGGLLAEPGATVGITNTLLAYNGLSTCTGPIAFGTHNLEFPGTTCATLGPSAGFSTADPLLASLALNVPGLTETHALLANSPARDAGHAATCAGPLVNNLDQRGVARPIDGDSIPGAVCDIGAYEAAAALWVLFLPLVLR